MLTHDERKHVKILQRRLEHLATRVASCPPDRPPKSWDLAEMSALRWALATLTGEDADGNNDRDAVAVGEAGRARVVPIVHGSPRDVRTVRHADVQRERVADRLRSVRSRWR